MLYHFGSRNEPSPDVGTGDLYMEFSHIWGGAVPEQPGTGPEPGEGSAEFSQNEGRNWFRPIGVLSITVRSE